MASALSAPHFHNEEAAFAYVEARVWPEGPTCPHCGGVERISKMQGKIDPAWASTSATSAASRSPSAWGPSSRAAQVPLHIWLQAMYLIAGSKKGISAPTSLHRTLGVTVKTAWFMSHRIREAMREGDLAPFGQGGGAVEVDETYIGRKKGMPIRGAYHHKMAVLGLVDRDSGRSRLFHVDKASRQPHSADRSRQPVPRSAPNDRRKHHVSDASAASLPSMAPCTTTTRNMCAAMSPPTPSKARSASSSAACAASISTAPRSTCTAIWPSLSFATATVEALGCNDADRSRQDAAGHRRQAADLSTSWCEGLMPQSERTP